MRNRGWLGDLAGYAVGWLVGWSVWYGWVRCDRWDGVEMGAGKAARRQAGESRFVKWDVSYAISVVICR